MHILEASIMLIGLVVLSNIISHYIVAIPTALIEIFLGVVVALLFDIQIELESDWFMLLFVAPLLFNDAKRFPKNELWELRAPIFANAILLVLLTTVVGGFFIHLLLPILSFPLSMALAAVLSPTDPVAVHGIAERVKLPKKILSLISGESLINDASGLIAFKYAVAAFLTGQFSLRNATFDFLYMSIFGAVIGYVLITLFHYLRIFLVQQGIRDVVLHTTIRILIPFIIYILADEVAHTSGVIAVVTAGVLSINQSRIFRGEFSEVRMVTHKMWDILVYLLNGVVFVILGVELPLAMRETLANPSFNNWGLLGITLILWFILLIIRVIWSYAYLWFGYLRNPQDAARPHLNTAFLTGLTGVRGAITMASILSLPLYLPSGDYFEERSLVIFLACGVVVTSLLIATITLPVLTKQRKRLALIGDDRFANEEISEHSAPDLDVPPEIAMTESDVRKIMTKRVIKSLEAERETTNSAVINDLLHEFEIRLHHIQREERENGRQVLYFDIEKQIQIIALNGQKKGVASLNDDPNVSTRSIHAYLNYIDNKKTALDLGLRAALKRLSVKIFQNFRRLVLRNGFSNDNLAFFLLEKAAIKGAIQELTLERKECLSKEKEKVRLTVTEQILSEYRHRLERLKNVQDLRDNPTYQIDLQEMYLKVLDIERNTIQQLFEDGKIPLNLANQLRQSVNYYESSFLQN